MYTVYKHTAPGGKVYIGLTGQPIAQRWRNGANYRNNKHFYRAIQLYGWENIKHEIIKEGLTKAEAAALEVELIAKYDSTNPEKGYNSSTGGEYGAQGLKHSAETRQKISEAIGGQNHYLYGKHRSAETRQKLSAAHKGKTHSAETRQKLSEASAKRRATPETRQKMSKWQIGKKLSEDTKRKISEARRGKPLTDEHRQKIREATSRQSAETRQKISEALKGRPAKNKIAVICLDTGVIYSSLTEAAEATSAKKTNISAVCRGKAKTAGGLRWAYYSDLQAPETPQNERKEETQANTPGTTKGA